MTDEIEVSEMEINAAARAIVRKYGSVIGAEQAWNIAYYALVAARGEMLEPSVQFRTRRDGDQWIVESVVRTGFGARPVVNYIACAETIEEAGRILQNVRGS